MRKIAVDFGTTNTVVAVWREATSAPETLRLPGLSAPAAGVLPPLVPSLLYVVDGGRGEVIAGQAVRASGYDMQGNERFFASFKRGIAARARPLPRLIDGAEWNDARAGEAFLDAVLQAVLEQEDGAIDELVLTVPIESFEGYLKWLRDETGVIGGAVGRLRVIDESTAAALGYQVRTPGELVLVFDFGGGTLDVSLVSMPALGEGGGVLIEAGAPARSIASGDQAEARVLAKAGRVLGGDDIDHWLVDEVLRRNGISSRSDAAAVYWQLKAAVEAAKIRLSEHESAEVSVFDPDTPRTIHTTFTRSQLEDVLERHGFYSMIQKTINRVLREARARGIFAEDVGAVLLVGGTSQMPSVRRMLRTLFDAERVFEHKPFEAVAHGALGLAVGLGLDDYLYHSYGIRHLNPNTGRHEWEEIIPAGTRYPLGEQVSRILTASRDGQEALELVIGEVEEGASRIEEVIIRSQAIMLVKDGMEARRVVALNDADGARTVAHLDPPGKAGKDRVEVTFDVDRNRTLRVTVRDLLTKKTLLQNVPVVELR
jgi:molecular chaperone DnaK (HSP70)